MKKLMLIMLAAVFQVAQMPHAAAVSEPWMTSEVTKASMAFDDVAGKSMTIAEFLKGFEGKISPEMMADLSKRAAKSNLKFELVKHSDTEFALVFGSKSFKLVAVDAIKGEYKFNGNFVKMNFEKLDETIQKLNDAAKFQRKTKTSFIYSLVISSAEAGPLSDEDGNWDMTKILLWGGLAAVAVGLIWTNYSNCNSYETLANQCGLNGQYGGGNPTGYVNAVQNLNNSWSPKFFCSSSNRAAATQCAWQTKMQLNQNFYANNPQQYGYGNFPRIATQHRTYVPVSKAQTKTQPVIFRGKQNVTPAPIVKDPEVLNASEGQR